MIFTYDCGMASTTKTTLFHRPYGSLLRQIAAHFALANENILVAGNEVQL